MAGNKKRTKRYVSKPVAIPRILNARMTADEHPWLAMQLYAAMITLIERPTMEACNRLSHQLCCIAGGMCHANKGAPIMHRTDAPSIAIQSAIRAIESIVDRHERIGTLVVSESDAATLRAAAGKLDDAIGATPLTAYRRAEREVSELVGSHEARHADRHAGNPDSGRAAQSGTVQGAAAISVSRPGQIVPVSG